MTNEQWQLAYDIKVNKQADLSKLADLGSFTAGDLGRALYNICATDNWFKDKFESLVKEYQTKLDSAFNNI